MDYFLQIQTTSHTLLFCSSGTAAAGAGTGTGTAAGAGLSSGFCSGAGLDLACFRGGSSVPLTEAGPSVFLASAFFSGAFGSGTFA